MTLPRRRAAEALVKDESGLSLVETLIAVMILGITFLSILTALTAAILASEFHRKEARTHVVLRNYAEWIKSSEVPYQSCDELGRNRYRNDTTTKYTPAAPDQSYQVTVTAVSAVDFSPDVCLLDLGASSPQGVITECPQIVKREHECLQIVKRKP